MQMKEELELLLHRKVDLVSKKAIEQSQNWLRRKTIRLFWVLHENCIMGYIY